MGDDSKCCSKCLGRDTIAVAAAMVAPAVVNISVPKGMFVGCIVVLYRWNIFLGN